MGLGAIVIGFGLIGCIVTGSLIFIKAIGEIGYLIFVLSWTVTFVGLFIWASVIADLDKIFKDYPRLTVCLYITIIAWLSGLMGLWKGVSIHVTVFPLVYGIWHVRSRKKGYFKKGFVFEVTFYA